MKVIYLAHPVRGDVQNNLAKAKRWVKWATESHPDVAVVASWITECEVFNDAEPDQREKALQRDCAVLAKCDEVWLVGGVVSAGMRREKNHATRKGVYVRDLTSLGSEPPGDGKSTWNN